MLPRACRVELGLLFGCLKALSKSVQVLCNGIETAMVRTSYILKS